MAVRRILGIDPGTNVMGYALLDVDGASAKVVVMGSVQMTKVADHYQRLKRIFDRLNSIIEEFRPDELAIESPFFGVNSQTTIKLGRAQGVCMAAALSKGLPISEYAPTKVKLSITGNGSAAKEQVAALLQRQLKFDGMPKFLDATDALAIAYTHFLTSRVQALTGSAEGQGGVKIPKSSGKKSSWADFVKENPDRLRK